MSASKTIACAGCGKEEELITVSFSSDWRSMPNGWLMRLGPEPEYACNTTCASHADRRRGDAPHVISLDQIGNMTLNDAIDHLKGVKDAVSGVLQARKKK